MIIIDSSHSDATEPSFLLLAISFNTETSFPERDSQPIIVEMSFFFQLDKVLLGTVDL